ncbi:gamma-glutamyltransferase family protein [Qipengyuania spongiae]|uniref:Gamma-glutamyltransferase family protein n=1 Tax=Qipengyuania spongiae TaxID=2909673 RepID=A0ABY5T006_9SPHN|nr:gamma-glutamyltransferase family protein [Qipengyuania spongiae]UVI39910.1 gamma-glutamyltransferase family protein [Qipengyuania spongiae]
MLRHLLAPLVALSLAGCATIAPPAPASTETITGSVSAADPRAEDAGREMLRRGGSATDAAIAVMLALTVVEPQSSGIGGGGFLVRGMRDGSVEAYDGRETAPAAATPDWFLKPDGTLPPFGESVRSGLSVGVPGNIALAMRAHADHGRLPWSELFEPAIRLARDGFQINPRLHGSLSASRDRAAFTSLGRELFFDETGEPRPVGHLVTNEPLARTLEEIAADPARFYTGPDAAEWSEAIAGATPRPSGMTAEDFANYRAKTRDPVCGTYRAHRVCSMGPPTSGGVVVLQMLGMLERFDLAALGLRDPRTWHLFVEAQRLAYADRELYLADSDFVSVPLEGLLDPAYLARRSAVIASGSTIETVQPGQPAGAPRALADGDEPEEKGTTHFAIVDADQTMISYTSTIEGPFGSGLMVGGFYLNNELTDFSRSPTVDGRPVANRVEGGKRPRSSMAPVVIYDPQGRPLLAIGAAGGATIPVQTARSIVGIIDFGLPAEDALGLPFIMAGGDGVFVEQGTWLADAIPALVALGHGEVSTRQVGLKAGAVLRTESGWVSARDPRIEAQVALP